MVREARPVTVACVLRVMFLEEMVLICDLNLKVIVLRGVWFVSLGSPPPMYTPSPESPVQLMTCVKGACDVAHRGSEALQ